MKLSRAIYNTLAIGAVVIGVANAADHSFSAEITNALSSSVNLGATITPSSTIEISANNVALEIVPSINGTFSSDYTTVSTYTNTDNTCTVTMTTSSTNLTSGNNTIPTLDSDVAEADFTNDRWGFRVGTSGNYRAVAANNTIATYSQTTGSTSLDSDVYFAAKFTAAIKAGNYTDTVTFISTCAPDPVPASINNLVYMQEFATLTSSEKAEVLDSMTLNQQYQLKDNRDEKDYYIAKLADGNVWMTQNLDHDIVTTTDFYTYANTDIGHGSTPNTNATWTADTATYATNDTTWNYTTDEPESYDPGNLCWNGTIRNDYNGTIATDTVACGNDKHYHIGNYYNWTAAVAMNDSSSYTTNLTDVDQSICPAGWRLPTLSGNKSYANLVTTLSLTSGASGNVQSAPTYFVYGGLWYGASHYVGGSGYHWSSVVNEASRAYDFGFDKVGYLYPQGHDGRGYGISVRCVAR
ncbi:hypothetical protein IKT18_02535 [Candidatus Saccharibacteria bacterium]|nr:hypothetical protein [Candidatus Saccharibacteria bacterium]